MILMPFFTSSCLSFCCSLFLIAFINRVFFPLRSVYWLISYNDFYFFHYSWFTMFCQFSTAQQGDLVTHTYIHFFFSHYHAPSQMTRRSSLCCTAGSHCLSIPKAIVGIYQPQIPSPSHSLPIPFGNHKSVLQVHDFLFCGKVHLCHKLDSRYKWNHMVFVFLFLTLLSMRVSSSIHVTANGIILFFFMA